MRTLPVVFVLPFPFFALAEDSQQGVVKHDATPADRRRALLKKNCPRRKLLAHLARLILCPCTSYRKNGPNGVPWAAITR